jgi:hypothetical protein
MDELLPHLHPPDWVRGERNFGMRSCCIPSSNNARPRAKNHMQNSIHLGTVLPLVSNLVVVPCGPFPPTVLVHCLASGCHAAKGNGRTINACPGHTPHLDSARFKHLCDTFCPLPKLPSTYSSRRRRRTFDGILLSVRDALARSHDCLID